MHLGNDITPRLSLGFAEAVDANSEFLRSAGFRQTSRRPTYVRYERGPTFIEYFHGRQSYEVGATIGRWIAVDERLAEEKFNLVDLVPALFPALVCEPATATTSESVRRRVAEVANLLQEVLPRLNADQSATFEAARLFVTQRSEMYLEGIQAGRIRADADAAWRSRDFAAVVEAYERLKALSTVTLTSAEAGRLRYADEHLGAG
ncbi:hypothetical protein B7486_56985 [cyanobacterium TDX16]|nr:hypothetical protein B7486_56985 [cyanobacterium TDX16]